MKLLVEATGREYLARRQNALADFERWKPYLLRLDVRKVPKGARWKHALQRDILLAWGKHADEYQKAESRIVYAADIGIDFRRAMTVSSSHYKIAQALSGIAEDEKSTVGWHVLRPLLMEMLWKTHGPLNSPSADALGKHAKKREGIVGAITDEKSGNELAENLKKFDICLGVIELISTIEVEDTTAYKHLLVQILTSRELTRRRAACVRALAAIEAKDQKDLVSRLALRQKEPAEVRRECVEFLSMIAGSGGIDVFRQLLGNESSPEDLKLSAARALRSHGAKEDIDLLKAVMQTEFGRSHRDVLEHVLAKLQKRLAQDK
jgi:hypothetical protein